ncbi:MAG: EamA family transporter RarD [Actinomycetes bacterium]
MTTKLDRKGLIYGVSACLIWGFFPLYWPLLRPAFALEILAHRVIWSLLVCVLLLIGQHKFRILMLLVADRRRIWWLVGSSCALSANWLIFIWAVNNNHFTESALGYYINPLVMVFLGVLVYKEQLSQLQWLAGGSGAIAVFILSFAYGRPPWIALLIATTWGLYGVIKKHFNGNALESLAAETLVLMIPALALLIYLGIIGKGQFGIDFKSSLLLSGAGIVTTLPLLMFNGAATRLPLSITGLLQYIQPSVQFLLGILVLHEKMSRDRWIGFGFIWLSLLLLAIDMLRNSRRSLDDGIAKAH